MRPGVNGNSTEGNTPQMKTATLRPGDRAEGGELT